MIYCTYFEIGGNVVTVKADDITDQSVTSISRKKMSALADLSSEAASAAAGRNGTTTSPSGVVLPYSVGVGRGNPRMWLGANAILWGAKMLHKRRPSYADYDKVM